MENGAQGETTLGGGGVLVPGLLKQMARPWQDHCLLNPFYHALPKGRRIEDAMRRAHRRPSFWSRRFVDLFEDME